MRAQQSLGIGILEYKYSVLLLIPCYPSNTHYQLQNFNLQFTITRLHDGGSVAINPGMLDPIFAQYRDPGILHPEKASIIYKVVGKGKLI
jgi:hypothetical protein